MHPDRFAEQLELLVGRGYRGVTFSEAVTRRPRGRTVAVTFDDAFASVATLARPILDRLELPATVFAVTSFAESGAPLRWPGVDHWADGPHARELESLDWPRLRELADAGWEVGSHTVTHPRLTGCDGAQLTRELADSRTACAEALLRPCTSIAFPYGDVDKRVVAATRQVGYAAAAALPARWTGPRPLEFPRAGVYHGDDLRRFRVKTSRPVRALRRLTDPITR